jgi:hypothetical protein
MTTSTTAQADGSSAGTAPVTARAAGRLTVLRASRLFDGISPGLIPDPVVVLQGSTILSVSSGTKPPTARP